MISVENTYAISRPIEDVWALFSDIERLGACVPTCKSVKLLDDKNVEVWMRIVLGIMPLENRLTMSIVEQEPPRRLVAKGISYAGDAFKGIPMASGDKGVSCEITILLDLEPLGSEETKVSYSIQCEAFGAIKRVYEGIIRGKRVELEKGFMENLRKATGGEVRELAVV